MSDDEWEEICDLFGMPLEPIDGSDVADERGPLTEVTDDHA